MGCAKVMVAVSAGRAMGGGEGRPRRCAVVVAISKGASAHWCRVIVVIGSKSSLAKQWGGPSSPSCHGGGHQSGRYTLSAKMVQWPS